MLFWNVFTQVLLPILVIFGCGWILDRRGKLDLGTLVKINIYVVVPAFIFHQIVLSELNANLAFRIVLFTLSVIASMFLLSLLVARCSGYSAEQTRSLQLATMFYNSGNYGIPLMSLAYPATGPLLQVFVVLTQNISTFTIGLTLAASTHRPGFRIMLPMLRQVSLWAVACALLVRGLQLPVTQYRWFLVPIEYFNNALVGIALLTLGAQLSQAKAPQSFPRLSWALALRLLGGPLVALAILPLFDFHGETAIVMILSCSFPTAVNTALLAHEFQADAQFAAAAVFYSTLLSMLSVSLLITLFRIPQVCASF